MFLASRFRQADALYQLGVLAPASERLAPLARAPMQQSVRLAALSRLTEIACDSGEVATAQQHLIEMQRCLEAPGAEISVEDRAELNYATARYAFSRRDGFDLERRAREAPAPTRSGPVSERVASLAIRINSYLAVDRYHRCDLAGASAAAAAAAQMLRAMPEVPPYVKTHALTTRGVVDLHDPARAHLAIIENVEALELALHNGMVSTAHDALFNIVNFWLYCDDCDALPFETQIVRETLDDALVAPSKADDPVLAALSLCSHGRYGEAIELLDRIALPSRDKGSDWLPIFFGPVTATKLARILFKAGRFADAERAAREALDAWERSHLGGQGVALRVRAEALEALGDPHAATAVIEDAIGELEAMRPLHHLVAAYKCAHRLTKKRAYRDHARSLIAALKKEAPQRTRLTPREREIAVLVSQGYGNKAIAAQLNLKPRTVENYVASIFSRLSIRARWQLTPDVMRASGS
ncbi:MAG: LuxR C-terminal-related transcriptional regulator [Candidatus Cybelea sp.]